MKEKNWLILKRDNPSISAFLYNLIIERPCLTSFSLNLNFPLNEDDNSDDKKFFNSSNNSVLFLLWSDERYVYDVAIAEGNVNDIKL